MGQARPTTADLDEQVLGYAQAVLAEWRGTDIWQPAQQLRAVTKRATEEYAGRFLLELLQNAHDAHPGAVRDGRCRLVLDEEENQHGVLYVANDGHGFTWDRVTAICKLALSPKVVGEGIGNKGVGFRSVLQICSAPEIYSSLTTGFDGYRFRFATPDDLLELLGSEELAARAVAELPPLQVPVPAAGIPATVAELGDLGHVTVIRLPLKSGEALAQVRLRLDELVGSDTPVMLFLERLRQLLVEGRTAADVSKVPLSRHETRLADGGPAGGDNGLSDVRLVTADLGDKGKFVVARGTVAPQRLRATVVTAVADIGLDETYLEWEEPAVVSLAVPADGAHLGSARFYTFLPLGPGVVSPAPAHLNAPFFTKIDRSALDPDHPLNAMLMDAAAETAVAAATALHRTDHQSARQLATRLVAWDRPHAQRMDSAARAVLGLPFPASTLVPVLPGGRWPTGWAPGDETLRWPARDLVVLTPRAVAERTGSAVIDEALGNDLLQRLSALLSELDCPLDRPLTYLADVAEQLVAGLPLPPKKGAAAKWNALYDDLARIFEADPATLRGRRILLAADSTVRQANGERAGEPAASTAGQPKRKRRSARQVAFFPPAGRDGLPDPDDGDDDFAPPAGLAKRLFYMHPELTWLQPEPPRRYTPTRMFLERSLVRPFDATSLIDHVRIALTESDDQRLRDQSLRFVFNLQRSRPYAGPPALKDVGLQLRTSKGWTPAARAVFGQGWPGTAGDDVALVVAEGASADPDLAFMAGCIIAPPDSLIRKGETVEEWMQFLRAIGVRDGLLPLVTTTAEKSLVGRNLTDDALVRAAKIAPAVAEQWRPHLDRQRSSAYSPDTPYVGTPMHRLPGQGVIEQLGDAPRLAYARLLLRGLAKWPQATFTSTWTRDRTSGPRDEQHVPTPVAAFLATQPWIPVRAHDRPLAFVIPEQAWLPPPAGEEEPPYVPLLVSAVRPLLEQDGLSPRLQDLGLAAWGTGSHAGRALQLLATTAADGRVRPEDLPSLRRENERAWQRVVARDRHLLGAQGQDALEPMTRVLVDAGDAVAAIEISALRRGETALYVAGDRHQVTAGLVRELELPLLVLPADAPTAAALLKLRCGAAVRHVDDADLQVEVDGRPLSFDAARTGTSDALSQEVPWLGLAMTALADHRSTSGRPRSSELAALGNRIRSIGVRRCAAFAISLDGQEVTLPARLRRALALPFGQDVLALIPAAGADWASLAVLAEPISDLVRRRDIGPRLHVAVLALQAAGAAVASPADEDLADALGISLQQLQETRQRVEDAVDRVVWLTYAVVAHSHGAAAAAAALEPAPSDRGELVAALAPVADGLPLPPSELVGAARNVHSLDELRKACGIPFADLNRTLADLPGYQPISRAAEHADALQRFLSLQRGALLLALRRARLARFDAGEPQPDWPALRRLDDIAPPDRWSVEVDEADVALLEGHVTAVLEGRLGSGLPTTGDRLPRLDAVQPSNRALISRAVPELVVLVRASGRALPRALAQADPVEAVQRTLDAAGALDFRALDPDALVRWLAALGEWPAGMLPSADPQAHGLSAEDLAKGRDAASAEQAERARMRRVLKVAETEVDVTESLADFLPLIQQTLDAQPGFYRQGRTFSPLDELEPRQPRPSRRSGAGTGRRGGDRGLSDAQTSAVGCAGEYLAWQALADRYPEANEASWVSTNRRHVFTGDPGDDGLGYDLEVWLGRTPLMFEVKAFRGAGGEIELGETEVDTARRHAGGDRWRVLVITDVFDPTARLMRMLPNPFSRRGRGRFRELGGSLRYAYRLP
jgi:hypothetical protein